MGSGEAWIFTTKTGAHIEIDRTSAHWHDSWALGLGLPGQQVYIYDGTWTSADGDSKPCHVTREQLQQLRKAGEQKGGGDGQRQ